jgi:hypothetical protein
MSLEALLDGTKEEIPIFDTLSQISNTDLLLVLRKSLKGGLSARLIGKDQSGNSVVRDGELKGGQKLLAWIESQMAYHGVVASQSENWLQVTTLASVPKVGQRGVVYANTGSKQWLPVLNYGNVPAALFVCEKLQRNSCASRILFLAPGAKNTLVDKKFRWLGE